MTNAELERLLADIVDETRGSAAEGAVATYIPALARAPSEALGLAVAMVDGVEAAAGDGDAPFSIQSISKVFNLAAALDAVGDGLWSRVGREATGMAFNSLILLEMEDGRPRNPLINAGALVVIDALLDVDPDWGATFQRRMRAWTGSDRVATDPEVRASEAAYGDLNRSIAWFLKAKGNLNNDPDTVTDAYFRACAVSASCRDLARAGLFLAGAGYGPALCPRDEMRRRMRSVMQICGLYDAAGEFAYRVGLPAKSGVGGGVLAVAPGRYVACAWSPPLDAKGNSVAAVAALERLTQALGR